MTFRNANEFPDVYEDLGVRTWAMGCLMLDTTKPYLDLELHDGDEHISEDPRKRFVKGATKDWHVTARYGFLDSVRKRHIDAVLEGFELPTELVIDHYSVFPSTDPEEPYDCVVARVQDIRLNRLNEQLSVLPNVNTFVEYKPHITIGYFRPGFYKDRIAQLNDQTRLTVKVLGLNYGDVLSRD